ncbi:MAG: N-acetylglucosamine-6-phosphate deacetylase [Vampirovibrionales bacterium]
MSAIVQSAMVGVQRSEYGETTIDKTTPVVLSNVTVVSEGRLQPAMHVGWMNGVCAFIQPALPADWSMEGVTVIEGHGRVLTHGLVDLQCNGAFGVDLNHTTAAQLRQWLKQLAQAGTTHVMLTLITAPLEDMVRAIQIIESVIREPRAGEASVLGIHLEGPFLNPAFAGIHSAQAMPRKITITQLETLCSPSVRMMTLAPELPGAAEAIGWLVKRGIVVFAGHTNATAEEMIQAVDAGLSGVTHLFNAMRGFHHRSPGILSVALTHPKVAVGLIADGHHVYPEAMRLALTTKQAVNAQQCLLVSDAMPLAGMPGGTQGLFAGQSMVHTPVATSPEGKVLVSAKVTNTQGTLAGAAALLNEGIRNVCEWGLVPLPVAVAMATENPAHALGLSSTVGRLAVGQPASWVLWHANWTPALVGGLP